MEFDKNKLKALRYGLRQYQEALTDLIDELEDGPPRYRSQWERVSRLVKIADRYHTDVSAMHIQAVDHPVLDLPVYLAEQSAAIVNAVLADTAGSYIRTNKSVCEFEGNW